MVPVATHSSVPLPPEWERNNFVPTLRVTGPGRVSNRLSFHHIVYLHRYRRAGPWFVTRLSRFLALFRWAFPRHLSPQYFLVLLPRVSRPQYLHTTSTKW